MPTYSYACAACGGFDLVRPMVEASAPAACPACGGSARRVFGAPALRGLDPAVRGALDAGARSAEAPDVVQGRPPGRSSRRPTRHTTDPRHQKLPRP